VGKVRFGISIPEDLSRELDELAEKTNVSRSELVEQAIRNMLNDYIHYLVPHECEGVMVAVCPSDRGSEAVIESASVSVLDFLTLRYGRGVGYWVVRIAAYLQALVFLINYLVINYPPAQFWESLQAPFAAIMGVSARIAIASITAFIVSETYDVFLVS